MSKGCVTPLQPRSGRLINKELARNWPRLFAPVGDGASRTGIVGFANLVASFEFSHFRYCHRQRFLSLPYLDKSNLIFVN